MERVTAVTFKLSQASGKPIFGVSINVMVEDASSAIETRVNLEIYKVYACIANVILLRL